MRCFEMPRSLYDGPGIRPSVHIFVSLKAPWFQITDGLPQHDERL